MTETVVAKKRRAAPPAKETMPAVGSSDDVSAPSAPLAQRGVGALDFSVSCYPGEPAQLSAIHARPPTDAEGYSAMIAASQFSKVLGLLAGSGRHPEAVDAAQLQRDILAARSGQGRNVLLFRYRPALTRAFEQYLAEAQGERLEDLIDWYKSNLRAVDG